MSLMNRGCGNFENQLLYSCVILLLIRISRLSGTVNIFTYGSRYRAVAVPFCYAFLTSRCFQINNVKAHL